MTAEHEHQTADDGLAERVANAVARATRALLDQQQPSGSWQGVVEAAANLEAEYVFLNRLLGRQRPDVDRRMGERLLALQQADGGWTVAPGLPSHPSTSIEAYFALKLVGIPVSEPALVRARDFIRGQGGLARAGVFTRFWLACFGQFPWEGVPAIPVETILLPPRSPFGIYALSSWTRATLVPFSLLMMHKPQARLPPDVHVAELWLREPEPADLAYPRSPSFFSWRNVFLGLDRTIALAGRVRWKPLRRRAVARAIEWILRHQEASGQWGGIQPAMVQSVLALHAVGFALEHPAIVRGLQGIDDLLVQCGDTLAYQPCVVPTWDTALAVRALLDAGADPASPPLARAAEWMLGTQIFRPGDWAIRNPDLDPGGWPLELANDHYPNVDASAAVLGALADLPAADTQAGRRALAHGRNWTFGMQSRDGGWAAFDTASASRVLEAVPFPDLEGLTDPPCADSTGHVLELMGTAGFGTGFGRVRRAREFLERTQRPEGCWVGRWGVNAIYGTWAALAGLRAVDEDPKSPLVQRAVAWLVARQNPDGGFGESVSSYDDDAMIGRGDSTPSQTAWAVLALLAADGDDAAVRRGVDWLVRTQRADGTWDEHAYTATGVPRRSYLRFQLFPLYFPLRALGQYRARASRTG